MVTEAAEEALARETETSPIVSTPPPKAIAELPAPAGWKKKFAFLNKDGTPKRRDVIIFVSPDGEEIKNKKDLDRYLKKHPGGPEFSEFDWSTGETPRRSARLSSKTKPIESPKDSGNKRARKQVSREAVSAVTEEVKEEPAKPISPTVEGKETAMEDVEKEAGETVKAEEDHISASVAEEEPSKKTEEVVQKKPEEEPEKLESEKDAVLAGNAEEVSGDNKHDSKVPLGEESQQNKEGIAQQSGLDTENLNSVHPKTGTSQMADLQNPSEPVGA